MVNKIDYEISLWETTTVSHKDYITSIKDLAIGQTYYYFQPESKDSSGNFSKSGKYILGYLKNITIDGRLYLFESYTNTRDSEGDYKPQTIQFTFSQVCQYVQKIINKTVEKKVLVLGSTNMTFEGRARNCELTTQLRGNLLTFTLPHRYFNTNIKTFETNPFIDQIHVDSIIKVRLEQDWYDLIVKEIVESKEKGGKVYAYTCEDLFIDELSHRGWELTFNEEVGMGTIDELAPKILNGTDWIYRPVYTMSEEKESDLFIEKVTKIKIDENTKEVVMEKSQPVETTEIKKSPRMVWNNKLKKMTMVYNETYKGREIYSYDTITDIKIDSCQNLLNNSKNFINTEYWETVSSEGNSTQTISTYFEKDEGGNPTSDLFLKLVTNNFYDIKHTSGTLNKVLKTDECYCLNLSFLDNGYLNSFNSISEDVYLKITIVSEKNNEEQQSIITNISTQQDVEKLFKGEQFLIIKPTVDIKNFTIKFEFKNEAARVQSKYFYLKEIQLFRCIPKKDKGLPLTNQMFVAKEKFSKNYLTPGQLETIEPYKYITTKYFTLDSNKNPEYFSPDAVTELNDIKLTSQTTFRKIRTLTSSQTNRMSLLEDLAELFEGFPIFEVEHDENGKIVYDVNGHPKKYITFKEGIVQNNDAVCFQFGVNLSNISRTSETNSLITKLYINNHETNGQLISIADSEHNPIRDNYLIDLSYYVKKGLINGQEYYNDLYSSKDKYLNYYNNLKQYNLLISEYSKNISLLLQNIANLEAQLTVIQSQITICTEKIEENKAEAANIKITDTTDEATKKMRDKYLETAQKYKIKKDSLSEEENGIKNVLKKYEDKQNRQEIKLNTCKMGKKSLTQYFENKYSQYIKEGIWGESNYLTSDSYYLDSLRVMLQNSKPNVSYSFNVIDLRGLPDYQGFDFKIRDRVNIEDVEFFGIDEMGTPNREKVIISEIKYDLDRPFNNTITVQNFETDFENLFQRIGKTITQAEFNK